jgi:deoxyribonuclease-1
MRRESRRTLAWVLVLLALGGLDACKDDGERPAHHQPVIPGNTRIDSFEEAKRLAPQVYVGHERDFYCDCPYHEKAMDLATCGYQPKSDRQRAARLEWEHVVPAEAFGQSFPEWREGHPDCVDSKGKPLKGRDCAKKLSVAFRHMEGDLHNLQPAVGEVNGRRSNYSMAMIEGERREFGQCDVEIADRKIEPRPAIRGDIARIYQYMEAAYPGRGIISEKNQKLFTAWAQEDPVDAWECERAWRIARLQGNPNPFVAEQCPH